MNIGDVACESVLTNDEILQINSLMYMNNLKSMIYGNYMVVSTPLGYEISPLGNQQDKILGSITFGPVQGYVVEFGDDPEDEDDEDWPMAE